MFVPLFVVCAVALPVVSIELFVPPERVNLQASLTMGLRLLQASWAVAWTAWLICIAPRPARAVQSAWEVYVPFREPAA